MVPWYTANSGRHPNLGRLYDTTFITGNKSDIETVGYVNRRFHVRRPLNLPDCYLDVRMRNHGCLQSKSSHPNDQRVLVNLPPYADSNRACMYRTTLHT